MSSGVVFGQLKSEKLAEENNICRHLAKEISTIGISDRQRLFLIYLLSLELESIEKMREIAEIVKDNSNDVFLSTSEEQEVVHGKTSL